MLYAPVVDKRMKGRIDFPFIDGMRAVAAISVAVLHAALYTGYEGDLAREAPHLHKALFVGNYAVSVFIVLSGFVLAMPIVANSNLKIRHGTKSFLLRRAKRILPPYFISMFLFGILIMAVPIMQNRQGTAWDSKVPVTVDGVIAHLFLVHNLNKDWAYQVNGPAWSIATEWQLYVALPLLILPLWRRAGAQWTLVLCLTLSALVAAFLPFLDAGHLWFLSLFAMGAVAARVVTIGAVTRYLGWGSILVGIGAGCCVLFTPGPLWVNEIVVGAAIALGLLWMAQRHINEQRSVFHRILESKPLVKIGLWSYSLYLIHSPLLGLGNLLALDIPMSTTGRFAFMVLCVLPVAAGIAYVFHVFVERRFITQHQQKSEPAKTKGDTRDLAADGVGRD